MFTYYDYLELCWSLSCYDCSCYIDYEECSIYCNNNGKKFCYLLLFDIMINYYYQTTGAVFIPVESDYWLGE